jgi:hypothetical protein
MFFMHRLNNYWIVQKSLGKFRVSQIIELGGDLVSTWELKLKEHSGAHEDLVKNVQLVIGNDYALAA